MSRAPWRSAYSMVGRVSRMRVSSMTRPSSSGTLKSTRMKNAVIVKRQIADGKLGHGHVLNSSAAGAVAHVQSAWHKPGHQVVDGRRAAGAAPYSPFLPQGS